jgi:hypothetical protein
MTRDRLIDIICLGAVLAAFLFFGQSIGWRVLGIAQLVFTMRVLKEKKIGVGWEGFKPSFVIQGWSAILLGIVSLSLAVMLLFFPEETVMKLGSRAG